MLLSRFYSVKRLTIKSIGDHVRATEYAVLGDLALRASQIDKEISGGKKFPFQKTIPCNIGNPHQLDPKPLTWIRQGLSLITYPELLADPALSQYFPRDIVEKAKYILSHVKGGVGAYSESQGLKIIRDTVSQFIAKRDSSEPPCPENIYLTSGATAAIELTLSCLISCPKSGIMIPNPQYPLISALITLKQGSPVHYFMDSNNSQWTLSTTEMQRAYNEAVQKGVNVKSLVVINPGNPTGQVLSLNNMKKIVEFCVENNLVLLADEVYQDNIYTEGKNFYSFKKVINDLKADIELFSYHSLSKGFFGECGLRGGYMEMTNIDTEAKTQIFKLASLQICSTTQGQIAMGLALDPPQEGSPSYQQFITEKQSILNGLQRKAKIMHEMLNSMDNIECNYVEGAMYAMPLVKFTNNAIQAAEKNRIPVDQLYASEALEETGIVIVPGSGFGQVQGKNHFRISILSPETDILQMLSSFKSFNNNFHNRYKD